MKLSALAVAVSLAQAASALAGVAPSEDQVVIVDNSSNNNNNLDTKQPAAVQDDDTAAEPAVAESPAVIRLWRPAPWMMGRDINDRCPEELSAYPSKTMDLPLDTCLSGEQYLHHNVKIDRLPTCPDGKGPLTLAVYTSRRCKGRPRSFFKDKFMAIPTESCMFQDSYYWSFVFRCGERYAGRYQSPEELKHAVAELPIDKSIWPQGGKPKNASVIGHLFPFCNGRRIGGHKVWSIAPDSACLSTPGLGLQILDPGTCPNNTRPLLARFADSKCHKRIVTAENGFVELHNSDLGRQKCMQTGYDLVVPGEAENQKVAGIMFWCDPQPWEDGGKRE